MHLSDKNELEKNCSTEIWRMKVSQLALPSTGISPKRYFPKLALSQTAHRLGLKCPNCRYTECSGVGLIIEIESFRKIDSFYLILSYFQLEVFETFRSSSVLSPLMTETLFK